MTCVRRPGKLGLEYKPLKGPGNTFQRLQRKLRFHLCDIWEPIRSPKVLRVNDENGAYILDLADSLCRFEHLGKRVLRRRDRQNRDARLQRQVFVKIAENQQGLGLPGRSHPIVNIDSVWLENAGPCA